MANSPCLEPPEVTKMRKHSRITLTAAREISNLNGDEYINVIKSYMLQTKEKGDKNKKNNKGPAPKENPELRQKKDRIERLLELQLKHMNNSPIKHSPKKQVDEYHDDFEDLDEKVDHTSSSSRINNMKNEESLPISDTTTVEIKNIARKDFAPRRLVDEAYRRHLSLAQLIKAELFTSKSTNSLKFPSPINSRPKSANNRLYNSIPTPLLPTPKLPEFAVPIHYSVYSSLPKRSILITIEQCCDCNYHISLKHDESTYKSYSEQAFSTIASCVLNHEKIINYYSIGIAKVSYCDSKNNRPKTATSLKYNRNSMKQINHPRVGALEIQLMIKDKESETKLLHSKLSSKLWPNISSIENKLDSLLYEHEQSLSSSSIDIDEIVNNGRNVLEACTSKNQVPTDDILWIIKHQVEKPKRDKILIEKIAYHDLG